MKKKKLSALLSLILTLCTVIPVTTVNAATLGVTIDNTPIQFNDNSGAPFVDDANRTQVPLRAAMEAYGCQVNWNSFTKIANIQKDGKTVEVPIGQPYIIVDGVTKSTDTAAVIKNNRTYLPIRAVLESFGATVSWDQATQTVQVISSGYTPGVTSEPNPTPSVTTPEPTPVNNMVWIPRTGEKYHSNSSCGNMKNPTQVSLDTAIQKGYTPCSKCY